MVSTAAGMATCGLTPFVATFASFLALLCCEQIRMDIAYSAQPVRLIGHHTGISLGFYGTSHHATEDIGTMRSIADLSIVSPADGPQLAAAIEASHGHDRPIYFRIGRGRDPSVYEGEAPFAFGRANELIEGEELTIFACGMTVHPALEAARSVNAEGRSVGVMDMASIKPLDRDAVLRAATRSAALMSVEEHNVLGGLPPHRPHPRYGAAGSGTPRERAQRGRERNRAVEHDLPPSRQAASGRLRTPDPARPAPAPLAARMAAHQPPGDYLWTDTAGATAKLRPLRQLAAASAPTGS